jgi:RHH-type rel operon transcriptional repressor/antitoxin RelB
LCSTRTTCYTYSIGQEKSVVTGLRLPEQIEQRLNHLAHETRRSKSFYIREAIQEYLEEHEDYLLAAASYEDYLKSGKKGISLEELKKKYRLDDDNA